MPHLRRFFSGFCTHSSSLLSSRRAGQPKQRWAQTALILSLAVGLLTLGVPVATAQQNTGEIVGTVVDPSGAAVKGATVTVKDVERGALLTRHTNESGIFDFASVPVGDYEVTVSQTGFQSERQPRFTLTLNQTARFEFQLKVGQTSEVIEVAGETPILATDTSLVGNILDAKTATDLPLPTGNTNQLTLVAAPGVITPNPFGFQAAQNTFGTGRPYVNGAREQENNFILDGMDNNQPDNNDVAYVPAPDAIQEFNLITGSAPADFGNYLGGVVNETLKSGTNAFHGDGWGFFRRGGWDANSYFNNADVTNGVGIPRPPVHFNDFGVTFGGPIKKDKLFFFADFEGLQYSQPATTSPFFSVPQAQLTGNFSSLCTAGFNVSGVCLNTAQQLYDPASSPANASARTPFAFNQVPIRSAAAANLASSALFPTSASGAVTNTTDFGTNSYQGDAKLDWYPSEKDHFMGRYSEQGVTSTTTNTIQLLGNNSRTFPLNSVVLDETHTFTSRLLNDVRVGVQYFPVTEGFSNPTGENLGQTFGIAGVPVSFLPAIIFSGGLTAPGEVAPSTVGTNDLVESFHDTTWQFGDTVTWTHNRHEFHFGFQAYHYIMNDLYPGNAGLAGQFSFNGQFTANPAAGSPGSAVADFLLGLPDDVQEGNGGGGNKYLRNSLFGGFAQDNWRLTNKLTLNLGLRYEITTARLTDNGQDVNFNLITGTPEIGFGYNTYNGIDNWQPRLGVAWQVFPDTVFRAAYGISGFMEANGVNNLPYQNVPFIEAHEANYTTLAFPASTLDQGYSNFPAAPCTAAALQALSPVCLADATLHLTNPNLQPAVDQQWNLTMQHEFGKKTSLQIAYVGNKIDHMSDIFIFNQNVLNPNGTVSPGPFAQSLINCCGAGNAPTIRFNDSSGIQRYNALQIAVIQRQWKGLNFQANYTWSKCMSNGLGYFGQFGDEEAALVPGASLSQTTSTFFFQNAYDALGNYGRCISDVASLFNGYLVYELPFGKGKMFGGNAGPVANAIIGGWSLASDFVLHTGFAVNPTGGSIFDITGTVPVGSVSPQASCAPGAPQQGSGALGGPLNAQFIQFLNPNAVFNANPGSFGNCGIGSFRGPGLTSADLSVTKSFNFTERTRLQLQAQFLNVTNTPIFGAPSTGAGNSFGQITSSYPGREIQLGGRFIF